MNVLAYRNSGFRPGSILLIQGTIITCLYLLTYAPLLPGLVQDWYEHENFSYGFLIPFVFIYLLWRKRKVLRNIRVEAGPWGHGSLSLLAAVTLGLIGMVIGDTFTMRISMILALGGSVYLVMGKQFFRNMLFPLAYLFLMVPLPYLVVKEISYHLRFFDAVLATAALQAIGVPVYQDSYFLHLPNIILEVADVCSGLSSVFAMFAVGAVYAYLLPARPGGKILILLGVILFPVLANLFRIVLISAIVYYTGPAILRTAFHQFTGTFIFILSLAMIIGLGEFLREKSTRTAPVPPRRQDRGATIGLKGAGQTGIPARVFTPSFSSALAILAIALYLGNLLQGGETVALQKDLQTLPAQLGPYSIAADGNWPDRYQDPDAERSLSRIYEGPGSERMELYIGYKSSQRDRNRLRSPKIHFSKGWNYVSVVPAEIELPGSRPIRANWMETRNSDAKRVVLYWYQARGHAYSGEVENRLAQVKSLILNGRTEGAVVRIASPVYDHENPAAARKRIADFAGYVYPRIVEMLPEQLVFP